MNIALAGNPNCGKTTFFNSLTGNNQYVGNWPGVTVEKKQGKYKKQKDVIITDLPGIYSLSPYTAEETVSRNYLTKDKPDAILNIVDSSNLERNLYLTTQLLELNIPTVIALNMIDVLNKSGTKIDTKLLEKSLGIKITETNALKNQGLSFAVNEAISCGKVFTENQKNNDKISNNCIKFSNEIENLINFTQNILKNKVEDKLLRWYAIKLLEKDAFVTKEINLSEDEKIKIETARKSLEQKYNDDFESIIVNERYIFISELIKKCVKKISEKNSLSDKIDKIVTNRWLGLPVFFLVMWAVYFISVTTVGTWMTDWTNDNLVGGIQEKVSFWLENLGTNEILIDCLVNGIIGGLGAILGFVPQMAILFLLLSIIEDCGYMVRIAFVMDRIFRKFGLSGKSFIPLLISSGCGVPGITASKTIENENDKRITIITATWIPCGAKLPVIALISAVLMQKNFTKMSSLLAPMIYLIGILSVLLCAICLKKTKFFHCPASPFVMELPQYHFPQPKTVLFHTWERLKGFIIKAGTILFVACIILWFLSSYGFGKNGFGLVEASDSLMAQIGNVIRRIFIPLGFGEKTGGWQAAAASISGFSAKEAIVGTMGVLTNVSEELTEEADAVAIAVNTWFPTALSAFSFLLFNMLDSPCVAAIGVMSQELNSKKWFWFAILFQNLFAYFVSLSVYQIGSLIASGEFTFWTAVAFAFVLFFMYMLFRKDKYKTLNKSEASYD